MLVAESDISLILVSHLKRKEGVGHEEGSSTSLSQLRGSASIAQLSDLVIGLERDGQADDPIEKNTTYVRVLKNRFSGETGLCCKLFYDNVTGRSVEIND
jgi:twinkle protein